MPSAGFESAVSATKQPQTHALDRIANGSAAMTTGFLILERLIFLNLCLFGVLNFHYHVLLRLTQHQPTNQPTKQLTEAQDSPRARIPNTCNFFSSSPRFFHVQLHFPLFARGGAMG
jgi:hypothetical protein